MDLSTFFTADYTLFSIPILWVVHMAVSTWYHAKVKKDFKWKCFPGFLKIGSLFMGMALLFNVLFTLMNASSYGSEGVKIIDTIRLVIILGAVAYYGYNIYKHARLIGMPEIAGMDKALAEAKEVPKEIAEKIAETVTQADEDVTKDPDATTPTETENQNTEDTDNGSDNIQ